MEEYIININDNNIIYKPNFNVNFKNFIYFFRKNINISSVI